MHSLPQSIMLHVLPGILTGAFYFLVRQPVLNMGYPSIFALVLAGALILIPIELGYLLYQGKKKTGRYTLDGVISYRKPIPWWQTLIWVLIVFVATGIVFTLMKPVDAFLQEKIFPWLPGLDFGLSDGYSKATLILTYALFFVFMAVFAPVVEELYFRGYLLPRMTGKYAPVLHSFLFAVYHTFTPWMIITRTIGLLPLIYTVQRKNISIGIIVHILVNTLDVVTGIIFISTMAS
jgi:membrane protease YdiL (CAAX protease family)